MSGPLRIGTFPPGWDFNSPEGRAMRSPDRRRAIGLCSCQRWPGDHPQAEWPNLEGRDPDCPVHNDQHEHAFWKQITYPDGVEQWVCPCGASYEVTPG